MKLVQSNRLNLVSSRFSIFGGTEILVLVDGISSEQAADEAIARIKAIFNEWQ